ncbi:hypothetical protein [uncultured Dubosiella sp.]|uniref:DUF488 family protein, N3 subclade n=1 Tax=uncultured Dubosiella sp. TaxID=1937011 RepID=UPI0035203707
MRWLKRIIKNRGTGKENAPCTALRNRFHHQPELFSEFKTQYVQELVNNPAVPDYILCLFSSGYR